MARRINSLDAARGTAMLFVCLSHFTSSFLQPWKAASLPHGVALSGRIAIAVSMIATPSFVLLSGMVIGLLCAMEPQRAPALRRKLIDRGLFLLVVGHPLQAVAYGQAEGLSVALRWSFITDVIAVAIIIGPTIVLHTTPIARLVAAGALLILSWCAALWVPQSATAVSFSRYALGGGSGGEFVGFPLIPWLGVYLLGASLGECMKSFGHLGDSTRVAQVVRRTGFVIATIGVAIALVRKLSQVLLPALMATHAEAYAFLSPARKFPPGPVYFLCFGGAALLLISVPFALERNARFAAIMRPLATLGRASFFVFVLQAYLYYVLLPAMNLPHPSLWPLYYICSIGLIMMASVVWDHYEANRYLSVGLWRTVPLFRGFRTRIGILRAPAVSDR